MVALQGLLPAGLPLNRLQIRLNRNTIWAKPTVKAAADMDPAFEKAFNAGDLSTLLKLYDDQSVLVAEPGKPVQGLENIKQALMGFLALKLPIQLTVRRTYESGDVGLCVADWSIAGKGPDGKDVKLGGTSAEVVRKTSGGNWVYVIDSPYGTA